jgi:hypothetical protein
VNPSVAMVDVVDVDMDVAAVADVAGVVMVVDVDDGKRSPLDDRAASLVFLSLKYGTDKNFRLEVVHNLKPVENVK